MLIRGNRMHEEVPSRTSLLPYAWTRQLIRLAAGLTLVLPLSTAMPMRVSAAQSSAVDTSHATPTPAGEHGFVPNEIVTHLDYSLNPGPHPECGIFDGVCIPTCLMKPQCMAFDTTALPGLGDQAGGDSARFGVYCYPPSGVPADSLVLYIRPCRDPADVQVRLYDDHGTLVDVLPLEKKCYETYGVMRHQIKTPRRPYQLEVVGHGFRRLRQIILGS